MDEAEDVQGLERQGIYYTFVPVPSEMLRDKTISLAEKGFLSILMIYSRPGRGENTIWPGIAKIAEECGCSEKTVKRFVQSLTTKGFIRRRRRLGTSSTTELAFIPTIHTICQVGSSVTYVNKSQMTHVEDVRLANVPAERPPIDKVAPPKKMQYEVDADNIQGLNATRVLSHSLQNPRSARIFDSRKNSGDFIPNDELPQ